MQNPRESKEEDQLTPEDCERVLAGNLVLLRGRQGPSNSGRSQPARNSSANGLSLFPPQHAIHTRRDNVRMDSSYATLPPLPGHINLSNVFVSPTAGTNPTGVTQIPQGGAQSLYSSTGTSIPLSSSAAADISNVQDSEEGAQTFGAARKKTREKQKRAELSAMFKELAEQLEHIEEHGLDPEVLDDEEEIKKGNNRKRCFGNSIPTNRIYLITRAIEVIESLSDTNRSLKQTVNNLRMMGQARAESRGAKRLC